MLKGIHAYADAEKVKDSVKLRAGKGKLRNRRRVHRRGPLIVYNQKQPYLRAFRNIPGIEAIAVDRLNVLQLAPGGHLGRFVVWFRDAFDRLDSIFGTQTHFAKEKGGFKIPRSIMTNPDLGRIINSDEVQSKLRPAVHQRISHVRKKNPLKNFGFLIKLNPYAKVQRRRQILTDKVRHEKKAELIKQKRADKKKRRPAEKKVRAYHKTMKENPCLYETTGKKDSKAKGDH